MSLYAFKKINQIKHLEINKILALNIPQRVDTPLNK